MTFLTFAIVTMQVDRAAIKGGHCSHGMGRQQYHAAGISAVVSPHTACSWSFSVLEVRMTPNKLVGSLQPRTRFFHPTSLLTKE